MYFSSICKQQTETTSSTSCAVFDRKSKQFYQVKTNKSCPHAFVKVYNLDQRYRCCTTRNHIPNPAFSYNNPRKSSNFTDILFHSPDEIQINLNLKHYRDVTRKAPNYCTEKESNVAEILKENRQKLDLLFKENVPVEELFPVVKKSQKAKRLRIKVLPKGPIIADHRIIPAKKTEITCQEESNLEPLEENTSSVEPHHKDNELVKFDTERTAEKSVPRVTFIDQAVDCDINVSSVPVDTNNESIMSTATETFIPPTNAVSRIREKHELQDINDRFSQYIQV